MGHPLSGARGRTARPRAAGLLGIVPLLALVSPAAAQEEEQLPPLSFAFATHAGSGIYSVEGRPVQIYRLPFSIPIRRRDEGWGLTITLPLTIGFYDFKPTDIHLTGLPEHIGTVSLLPGVRFDLPATDIWTISPFAELGAAKDMEGGDLYSVNGLGIDSDVRFLIGPIDSRIANRVLASGSRNEETDETDSYGEFRTGFEMAFPLGGTMRGQQTDLAGFIAHYLYFQPPDDFLAPLRLAPSDAEVTIRMQWEVGATFGTRKTARLWKIPIPRIGLSYRFGDGPESVRLVFGLPF